MGTRRIFDTLGSLNKLQELENIEEEDKAELLEKREMIRNLEEEWSDKNKETEGFKQMLAETKSIDHG